MRVNFEDITLLVVEDEAISLHYLVNILYALGCKKVYEAINMQEALHAAQHDTIDVVFMDINIQGPHDGIQCAKELNALYAMPIIFTTAYGDSQTILEASYTNTYAYLIKPFEPNDVEANLIVVLSRLFAEKKPTQESIQADTKLLVLNNNYTYNLKTKTLYNSNKAVYLSKRDTDILHLFCKNINCNVSHDMLTQYVWEYNEVTNSTIRNAVSRLKRKAPNLDIQTLINFGYILKT